MYIYLQRKWLNEYNARIRDLVGSELKRQNRMDAFFWMMDKTKYIPVNGQHKTLTCQRLGVIITNVVLVKTLSIIIY